MTEHLYGNKLQWEAQKIFEKNGFKCDQEAVGETDILAYCELPDANKRTIFITECKGCTKDDHLVLIDSDDTKNFLKEHRRQYGSYIYHPLEELSYNWQYYFPDALLGLSALGISDNYHPFAFSRIVSKGDFFHGPRKKDGFFKGVKQLVEACSSERMCAKIESIAKEHCKTLLEANLSSKIVPLVIVSTHMVVNIFDSDKERIQEDLPWVVYDVKDKDLQRSNTAALKYVFVVNFSHLDEFIKHADQCGGNLR